jgi:hypothetical protein
MELSLTRAPLRRGSAVEPYDGIPANSAGFPTVRKVGNGAHKERFLPPRLSDRV